MPLPLTVALCILIPLLVLCLLYLLSVMPNRRRRQTAYFASFNYAHRGLHDRDLPENSLAAFEAACRAGYGIELDVQLSRDGVPMVFHDDDLRRVCGVNGRVRDYAAEELVRLALFGRPKYTVPSLRLALETVRGRVPLLVEIKADAQNAAAVCEAAMQFLDRYRGPYFVESFNPYVVAWFKKNRPHLIRGQLSSCFMREKKTRTLPHLAVETLCTNFLTRPDFIAYDCRAPHHLSLFLATRLFGAARIGWTPRGDREIADALSHFDAVIFEHGTPPGRNHRHET